VSVFRVGVAWSLFVLVCFGCGCVVGLVIFFSWDCVGFVWGVVVFLGFVLVWAVFGVVFVGLVEGCGVLGVEVVIGVFFGGLVVCVRGWMFVRIVCCVWCCSSVGGVVGGC